MSTPRERDTRAEVVRFALALHARGWVANHDGNISARVARGRLVATPTAFSKAAIDDPSLIVVNDQGERVAGAHRPFSELSLHLAIYAARDDAAAVVHAHPPFATAMACAGVELGCPFIPEAIVSLGDRVPLVPFAAPSTPEFTANLTPFLPWHDVFILEQHGVIALGDSVEQAFLRLELVEHLARVATHARPWGGVRPLPRPLVDRLLDARARAGLGPVARGLDPSSAPAPRPAAPPPAAPPRSDDLLRAAGVSQDEISRLITEELTALLGGS